MAFLDTLNTVVAKEILPGVGDGVFRNSQLLSKLRSSGVYPWSGHTKQENIQYDALRPVSYAKGDTFDLSQKQLYTGATVTPRYKIVTVNAFVEDLRVELNDPRAAFDYVDGLLQNAALSMSAGLANDAYRHGQNLSGSNRETSINGLDEALSDGVVNGFDGRTYPTYLTLTRSALNSALNSPMTGPAAAVAGSISYPIMEEAYNSVCIGPEEPDLMVTTNKGMSFIKMAFQSQWRFEPGTDTTQLGVRGIRFNNAIIIQDQYAPGARTATSPGTLLGYSVISAGETLWFLNTKYLRFYLSTDPEFAFGFTGFMPAQGTSALSGHYKFAGNLTCQAPRLMRYLHTITG
jgi:hypothetical protein